MKKWEYDVKTFNSFNTKELNELGIQGWELVSTVVTSLNQYKCVFKREKVNI